MNLKYILLLAGALPVTGIAQTKEHIATLPEGEFINTDNSKVIPKADGADFELTTQVDRSYFRYTRTVKKEPTGVDVRPGKFVTLGREAGMKYFRVNETGKKYGPHESIMPRFDEEKQILYAYSYKKDGKDYFMDLLNDKLYGPFDKGQLWHIDENNLVYSYTEINEETGEKKSNLILNGEKSGPYEGVSYMPGTDDLPPYILQKKDGKYYVGLDQCRNVPFGRWPRIYNINSGWVVEGVDDTEAKTEWIYLPDGTKLENSGSVKHMVNSGGDILRLDHIVGSGSGAAYKVSYNGNLIDTFGIKKSYRQDLKKTDFFPHYLVDVTILNNNTYSRAQRDRNYLFSPNKGLIGPMTQNEMRKINFFPGGYAKIVEDSTLYINGKKLLEGILYTDFRGDDDTWWAFQQRGDYVYPYKNGQEVSAASLPERLSHFDTEEQPVVRVRRGDEFFLRVKGKDGLLGPVRQYDPYEISTDGNHYAYVDGRDGYVYVDGKAISRGFNIVYNPEMDAFHWLNQQDGKVYLVTIGL